jgi:hypothetical protein
MPSARPFPFGQIAPFCLGRQHAERTFIHTHCSNSNSVCTCRRSGRRKKIRAVIFRGVLSMRIHLSGDTLLRSCFVLPSSRRASECMRARRPPAAGLRPAGRKKCTAVHGPLRAHQSAMWENPTFLLIPTFSAAALWPSTKFCTCICVRALQVRAARTPIGRARWIYVNSPKNNCTCAVSRLPVLIGRSR